MGVRILTSPGLRASQLQLFPVVKRVTSMRFPISGRKTLTVVCAYVPNRSTEYSAFLEKALIFTCAGGHQGSENAYKLKKEAFQEMLNLTMV